MDCPQFRVLIDSPIKCFDVHGMGESGDLPATWHCVISHITAEMYHHAVDLEPKNGEREIKKYFYGLSRRCRLRLLPAVLGKTPAACQRCQS